MPHTTFSGQLALLRAASGSPPLSGRDPGAGNTAMRSATLASKHLDGSHIVCAQISNLVSQLSKRNFRQTSQELSSVRDTEYPAIEHCAVVVVIGDWKQQ